MFLSSTRRRNPCRNSRRAPRNGPSYRKVPENRRGSIEAVATAKIRAKNRSINRYEGDKRKKKRKRLGQRKLQTIGRLCHDSLSLSFCCSCTTRPPKKPDSLPSSLRYFATASFFFLTTSKSRPASIHEIPLNSFFSPLGVEC